MLGSLDFFVAAICARAALPAADLSNCSCLQFTDQRNFDPYKSREDFVATNNSGIIRKDIEARRGEGGFGKGNCLF